MKVFFTASLEGVQYYKQYYQKIFNEIEAMGFENLDNDLFTVDRVQYYYELKKNGRKARTELFKRKISSIQKADVCIFESTLPDLSIGFLIEKSLNDHKPTIVLYLNGNIPFFLDGVKDDKLIVESYVDQNIKKILTESIGNALHKRDQRYNFFINTELLNYLEETSRKRNTTKSAYLRSLIEKDKKSNVE